MGYTIDIVNLSVVNVVNVFLLYKENTSGL